MKQKIHRITVIWKKKTQTEVWPCYFCERKTKSWNYRRKEKKTHSIDLCVILSRNIQIVLWIISCPYICNGEWLFFVFASLWSTGSYVLLIISFFQIWQVIIDFLISRIFLKALFKPSNVFIWLDGINNLFSIQQSFIFISINWEKTCFLLLLCFIKSDYIEAYFPPF